MIEPRDGKHAYVYSLVGLRQRGSTVDVNHATMFDVADSDDEAYGRAMRAALLVYPESKGWRDRSVQYRTISGIDWVRRHDLDQLKPTD